MQAGLNRAVLGEGACMEPVWVVLLASAALLIRAGQTLGAMGMARAKNVASAGVRSLADLCVATLAFWALGAAILFQLNNPVFGIRAAQLIGWSELSPQWFSSLAAVFIATGIIAPALAERSKMVVPLATGALLAGLVVPMMLHWTRYGWLGSLGFRDTAGAAAIHFTPAVCAAIAVLCVGPREGKYNRDGSSNMIPGHSVPMILVSVMLMFVGWIPYTLAMEPRAGAVSVAANVMVAAAAAGAISLLIVHIRFGKVDILLTCSAVLGGLVSTTAAAGFVRTPVAFLIGLIAGVLIPWMTVMIDLRWKIDDPGGVIAIHGVGGLWALLAAAIFRPLGSGDYLKVLGVQLLGIVVITLTIGSLTILLMLLLRATSGLRAKEADEYDGLDLAEHDINAHPDFQQTMIKSYHLREA